MNYGRDGVTASEVRQGEARKRERIATAQRSADLTEVASTPAGRRFLSKMIDDFGTFDHVILSENQMLNGYTTALRAAGCGIFERLWSECPIMLIKLIEENPRGDDKHGVDDA